MRAGHKNEVIKAVGGLVWIEEEEVLNFNPTNQPTH
jgi:hypothetical protein